MGAIGLFARMNARAPKGLDKDLALAAQANNPERMLVWPTTRSRADPASGAASSLVSEGKRRRLLPARATGIADRGCCGVQ